MIFSLLNVTETNPDGTVNGYWLQDHIGSFQGAAEKANRTAEANSNRIEVAVIERIPGVAALGFWTAQRVLKHYRLRFYCGPVGVYQIATAARKAGFPVVDGTAHLWIDAPGEDAYAASEGFLAALRESAGTDYGLALNESRQLSV